MISGLSARLTPSFLHVHCSGRRPACAAYRTRVLAPGRSVSHHRRAARRGDANACPRSSVLSGTPARVGRPALPAEGRCLLRTTAPSAPAPHADEVRTLHLSELIKRPVTSRDGEPLGRISDVVVRLRGSELPLVIGGVASVGGRQVFVPMEQVS